MTLPELVDLYGTNGFDVLAVTDHVVRPDPTAEGLPLGVRAGNHADYLAEIAAQAERARHEYDLLLLPGFELTYNDLDPLVAAHAGAVGCRSFVGVDDGIETALRSARESVGGRRRRPSGTTSAPLASSYPYVAVMNRIGRERGWPPSGKAEYEALASPSGPLALGSPEEVAAKIVSFHELFRPERYLAHIGIGAVSHRDVMRAIELFGTEVAPLVEREVSAREPRSAKAREPLAQFPGSDAGDSLTSGAVTSRGNR